MPTPLSWPIAFPSNPPVVGASGEFPCPTDQLPISFFLAMFDRIFPESWLAPLKSPGPGYEVLESYAALNSRVSLAVEHLGCDSFFFTATGGSFATGTVQLSRASALTQGIPITGQSGSTAATISGASAGNIRVTGLSGVLPASVGHQLALQGAGNPDNDGIFQIVAYVDPATVDIANSVGVVGDPDNGAILWEELQTTVVVKAGTVVTTSSTGLDFVLTADTTFNQTDLGPFDVPVVSVAQDYAWNVPGTVLTAANEVLPGDIDTIKNLIEDPALGDLSIVVTQAQATLNGRAAALDQLGADRGLPRETGEPDSAYRNRVRSLPDTISPDAMERAARAVFQPLNGSFELIETWDIAYQTCYDAPPVAIPGTNYDPNLFVYDDPRPPVPFRNRYLDENDYRGGFIVVTQLIQPLADEGFFFDDTAENLADAQSSAIPIPPGGSRALCAYDVPGNANPIMLQCFWDGLDIPRNAAYFGLYNTLQKIKAAGTVGALELEGQ